MRENKGNVIICSSLRKQKSLFEPLFEEMTFQSRWQTGAKPLLVIGKEGGPLFSPMDAVVKDFQASHFPILFLFQTKQDFNLSFLSYPLKEIESLPSSLSGLLESLLEKRQLPMDRVLHRIRSPLSTAILNCELLVKDLPSEVIGTGKIVRSLKRNLLQIEMIVLAHLKEYRRLSSIRQKMQATAVMPILERVLELLQAKCVDRKVRIDLQIEVEQAVIHPLTFEEVLHAVLENAILYTEAGSTVSVTMREWKGNLKMIIADQGRGISKREAAKVFQKFYRSPQTMKAHPEGSGLGLYLAKTLLNAMGGSIHIQKNQPQGTRLVISIPQGKPL